MANAYYTNQYISTTLASVGGIDDSATTGIILASVTNITTDKPGIACLSYTDPIDTSKAEWITYTSIDSGTKELQGVTRGQEDFSAKPHNNGVTVAFPLSKSHINNLNDALIIGGAETNLVEGVIDDDTMATASATTLATSESTKAYSDSATQTLTNKTLTNPTINFTDKAVSQSVMCRAYLNTTPGSSLTDLAYTKVLLDTENFDIGSDFDVANSRFVAPVSGYYRVDAGIYYTNLASNRNVYISIYVNGSAYTTSIIANTTNSLSPKISTLVYCPAGQYIELYARVNVGDNNATLVVGTGNTHMSVELVSL